MLRDRAEGWSLASLMQKYNVKSHRSIVYLCQKHHVYPPAKPTILYHVMPIELTLTIRSAIRQFPTERTRVQHTFKKREQTVEKVSWWCVEDFVKQGNYKSTPMYSFTL